MKDIDISYLFRDPTFEESRLLTIKPLAPLSVCNDPNGVYYKSSFKPSVFKLMGLLENIIGIHISLSQRLEIVKNLKRDLRTKFYKTNGSEVRSSAASSLFFPLIQKHVEIEFSKIPSGKFFDDLVSIHSACIKRDDRIDKRHTGGVKNIDKDLMFAVPTEPEVRRAVGDERARAISIISKHPMYYSGPKSREYFVTDDEYQIQLNSNSTFFQQLTSSLEKRNSWFLGTSESIVKVSLS